jgi:nucleoside-diphosphate-sugar epimerase
MTNAQPSQNPSSIVVVGAGQIGTPMVERLRREGHAVTWISRRRPDHVPEGVRHVALDASDGARLAEVARGARALIAAVNPPVYDAGVWAQTLPALHRGLIEGAAGAGTRLVLLDALYLYTTREGPLAPTTRQAPETAKGKVRKELADMLVAAQREGLLRATVLRAPDFWGPELSSALLTRDALAGLRSGKRALLIGNPEAPHAFAHRDDVIGALIALAFAADDVEGQVFHAPVIHETPRAMVEAYAKVYGVAPRVLVAPGWLLRVAGLFSRQMGGLVEMLPQWESPYLVDDSSFRLRFGAAPISLAQGAAR